MENKKEELVYIQFPSFAKFIVNVITIGLSFAVVYLLNIIFKFHMPDYAITIFALMLSNTILLEIRVDELEKRLIKNQIVKEEVNDSEVQ